MLSSIAANTILPNIVTISCSGHLPSDPTLDNIKQLPHPFPIIWTISEDNHNIATNRNIAAKLIDTTILSFMDADDMAQCQRHEYIIETFKHPDTTAVVHNYWRDTNLELPKTIHTAPDIYRNYLDMHRPQANGIQPSSPVHPLPIWYHGGHISILRQIYLNLPSNEDPKLAGAEDTWYLEELIRQGYKITYIHNKLSLYIH